MLGLWAVSLFGCNTISRVFLANFRQRDLLVQRAIALQRDLGPMPLTSLEDGIRQTLESFRRLQREGCLDTADLDAK